MTESRRSQTRDPGSDIRHSIHWTVLLLGPALLFLFGFGGSAFVVEVNDLGDTLRWHLNPLEPPVPPNPPDQGVHTNVVNPATKAIRYFLASDAYSAANAAAELNAVRAAFAQWQAVPGTVLKFEDAGVVAPGVDVNTSDNQNVVFWAKNSPFVNGGRDNISGALGATFHEFFPDNNALAEADIVFNGTSQYNWSSDFNSADTGKQFIEGTALHELGLRHPVAHQADHLRPAGEQGAHHPGAHQSGGAGDQRGAIEPEAAPG